MEEWRTIRNYPNYLVSDGGRIYSLKRGGQMRKPVKDPKGYFRICLNRNTCIIHRLVLEAFIGKCPDGMECNHKDGVKSNNRLENLEWVTPSENMQHAFKNNLASNIGEKNGRAKLDKIDVISIGTLKEKHKYSLKRIAELFEVSLPCIWSVVHRKNWNHI